MEQMLFSRKANTLSASERKEFINCFYRFSDVFIDEEEEGHPIPLSCPWLYKDQELIGFTIEEMAWNYVKSVLDHEDEEEEMKLKLIDSEFDK